LKSKKRKIFFSVAHFRESIISHPSSRAKSAVSIFFMAEKLFEVEAIRDHRTGSFSLIRHLPLRVFLLRVQFRSTRSARDHLQKKHRW
jgi:hypothetical protein